MEEASSSQNLNPSWYCEIGNVLDNYAVGYSWIVMKDGIIIDSLSNGYARAPWESQWQAVPMTTQTKMNTASVSKTISAVALLNLLEQDLSQLDNPFWPYIMNHPQITTNPAAGIQSITLRQLLQMSAGLGVDRGGSDYTDLSKQSLMPLVDKLTKTM